MVHHIERHVIVRIQMCMTRPTLTLRFSHSTRMWKWFQKKKRNPIIVIASSEMASDWALLWENSGFLFAHPWDRDECLWSKYCETDSGEKLMIVRAWRSRQLLCWRTFASKSTISFDQLYLFGCLVRSSLLHPPWIELLHGISASLWVQPR